MRRAILCALVPLGGLAAWQGVQALQNAAAAAPQSDSAAPVEAPVASAATVVAPKPKPKVVTPVPPVRDLARAETPMAGRVAVLGVLNKRNGIFRDITLRPGQAMRLGDLIVRLRACETTADWEPEQLTGAFVQVDVRARTGIWGRVFSGWVYRESPSLNVVEHPIYDVWPKSCAMTHPDIGPETLSSSSGGEPRRSSRPKSTVPGAEAAATPAPVPATPPAARAASSNER